MIPITLRIRKRGEKYFDYNQTTIASFITVGVITKEQTLSFFSRVKYDSQFANYLKNNYGIGIYSVLSFRKGQNGFRNFIKVECKENSYIRLKKRQTQDEKERARLRIEKRKIEKKLKEESNISKQNILNEDLNEVNELVEIYKDDESIQSSCYPYLKTLMPCFKEHSYDEQYKERPRYSKKEIIKKDIQEEKKDSLIEEVNVANYSWR